MQQKTNYWQVMKGIAAGLLGVQKHSEAQKDFAQSNAWPYIIGGTIALIIFILLLIGVVQAIAG